MMKIYTNQLRYQLYHIIKETWNLSGIWIIMQSFPSVRVLAVQFGFDAVIVRKATDCQNISYISCKISFTLPKVQASSITYFLMN